MHIKESSRDPGIRLLRIGTAILLLIHGIHRLVNGGVEPFGQFLSSVGIPLGRQVAWLLTIAEIAGSVLLGLGMFIIPVAAWFAAELIGGIILVHGREGWFVVGGGRNGVEYNVALILALAAVALSEYSRRREAAKSLSP